MAESNSATMSTEATQKKRSGKRTARACDECRMRKSKCDGLQPCEACRVTDRYCTFNLSASRSTGSGTRIRILEDRLRRARAYLNEAQKRTPSLANVNFDALLGPTDESAGSDKKLTDGSKDDDQDDDQDDKEKLDSMMDSYGQLTMSSNGREDRDFYGAASGLAWIQKTGGYFKNSKSSNSGESTGNEDDEANSSAAVQLFDAPLPPKHAMHVDDPVAQLLPSRKITTKLLHTVFTQVYPMFHFLCEKSFHESTDRIYQMDPSEYQERDQSFLPLLYLVVALGHLFSKEMHDSRGCRASISQGYDMRLFIAARSMLDIAHLRTIVSLQTVISLILFLISTARMASAHAFLGAACAASMRQGLHFRSTHDSSFCQQERNVRRRVFWAVMNLDMYISAILGLPPFMNLSAVDPAIDVTIESALKEAKSDNEALSPDGLALAASAKHIELMRIIFKAQRTLYPKPTDPPDSKELNATISVNVSKLQEVENQFREWAESLVDIFSHSDDSTETQSIRYELHLCYYFAQIVLYRAFLHYLAKQREGDPVGKRQLSYARTCVRMSTKVIEVSIEHQKRGLLCPASWPSIYTVFLSVVCLVFSYVTREEGSAALEIKEDIENGIRLLACTACTTDTGSVRCLEILRRLIKRVSYGVDIDLDQIVTDTTPCCTLGPDITPTRASNKPMTMDGLHGPVAPGDSQTSWTASDASQASSSGVVHASSGYGWSLSPDASMTQPPLAMSDESMGVPGGFRGDEEMLEIPFGGTFSWPEHEFHSNAMDLGQPGSSRGGQQTSGGSGTSQNAHRLSATDIAAFMHINPVDEPYQRIRNQRV